MNGQFRQPTDVTWDHEGTIFISDGYINSRVAKFDKNGNWVKQWGEPGKGPGEFDTPHSIASDAKGNIYVADRGNRRIQVFDRDGNFLREMKIDVPAPPDAQAWMGNPPVPKTAPTMQPGSPWAMCITPGPRNIYTAPMRFQAAFTSCRSMARCWECLAQPAISSNNSAGSMNWRAPLKTKSMPPRS